MAHNHAAASFNYAGDHPAMNPTSLFQKVVVVVVTVYLLYLSNVASLMFSDHTFRAALYPAYALYLAFCGMWAYSAVVLQKNNIMWFQTNQKFIQCATLIVTVASVLWIIGMWPALGVWTIPVYMVLIAFISNLYGLVGSLLVRKPKVIKI